jgi:hypothetical protein
MTDLPPSLERFQGQLEAAVARDRKRSARFRPTLVRTGVVVCAAAAIIAGVSIAGIGSTNGSSVLDQAAAAIAHQQNAILHVDMIGTQTNPNGSTDRWEDESWQATAAPHARRQIEKTSNAPATDTALDGLGLQQLYDASTNTIFESRDNTSAGDAKTPTPDPSAVAKQRAGTDKNGDKVIVTKDKGGKATVGGTVPPITPPTVAATPGAADDMFRQQAVDMLHSGNAKVERDVVFDGRKAIRITSTERKTVYIIDADTYAPIEWQTRGDGGGVTLHFDAYETLPASDANMALLSLTAQHPSAKIDTNPAHYSEATGRLFPGG